MRKLPLLLLLVVGAIAPQTTAAQSADPSRPIVRYHYGDNPAWASPAFDDSSWIVAANGSWPVPAFHSDGFVWLRARVPMASASSRRLAIRLVERESYANAYRLFVNNRDLGGQGGFPPSGQPFYLRSSAVFCLSTETAAPGATAVVALRLWYLPAMRLSGGRGQFEFRIAESDTADATQRASLLAEALGRIPNLAANALLMVVGAGLLIFWLRTRRSELLWCALLLISYPLFECFFDATDLGFLSIPYRGWTLLCVLLCIPTMATTVELIWTVHGLHARIWRRLGHLAWMLYNGTHLLVGSGLVATSFVWWSHTAEIVFLQFFNAITLAANLWVLLVRRYNRAIAAAMSVIPVASGLAAFGWREYRLIHNVYVDLFDLGFLLSGFAIAAMLVRRALAAWRQSDQLRVEFAAAREVQQRLVPAAPPRLNRFSLRAVYVPAAEVGGDFYQVFPQPDGSALLVIGDVSGKGLKAAMTGTLVLGGLQTLAQENLSPAEILARLNVQLVASSGGGFVTCLCARLGVDGSVSLANAGHLAPYCNGDEVSLLTGLPLGITRDADYFEIRLRLNPGDTLTFLSDGVVEAQDIGGQLFGFDRMKAISAQSAEQIAAAAQAHGQQDDITVLTLQFAPAELTHA